MDNHPASGNEPEKMMKPKTLTKLKLAAGGVGITLASVLAGAGAGFGYTQWLHATRNMGGWGFALIIYPIWGAGAGLVVGVLLAFIWGVVLWVKD